MSFFEKIQGHYIQAAIKQVPWRSYLGMHSESAGQHIPLIANTVYKDHGGKFRFILGNDKKLNSFFKRMGDNTKVSFWTLRFDKEIIEGTGKLFKGTGEKFDNIELIVDKIKPQDKKYLMEFISDT